MTKPTHPRDLSGRIARGARRPSLHLQLSVLALLTTTLLIVGCAGSASSEGQPTTGPLQSALGPPTPTFTTVPAHAASPTSTPIPTRTATPTARPTRTPTVTPRPVKATRIAVIGDYGMQGSGVEQVSKLVKSWQPDLIITLGDNNYPAGEKSTIDQNIGQYYHDYIGSYDGRFGAGSERNRFFPVLGNHDWMAKDAQPYFDYFTLPGNERYYWINTGPARLFALDSDYSEPHGVSSDSKQAKWLQKELKQSDACWNLVYMHHAPFSSGLHGSSKWMRWPYQEWGADAVLGGHDHHYERIERDGMLYFVNGLGGAGRYPIREVVPGSELRYRDQHGAMLIEVTPERLRFRFVNRSGDTIDTHELRGECPSGPE